MDTRTMSNPRVTVIDMWAPMIRCSICGEGDYSRWGVPIATDGPMTGLVVANEYVGDWAAKPACRECWAKHEVGELVGVDPPY